VRAYTSWAFFLPICRRPGKSQIDGQEGLALALPCCLFVLVVALLLFPPPLVWRPFAAAVERTAGGSPEPEMVCTRKLFPLGGPVFVGHAFYHSQHIRSFLCRQLLVCVIKVGGTQVLVA
jgi:hypothetical protein